MVTLVSQISNYFEQLNGSLATPLPSTASHGLSSTDSSIPLSFYIFDFERNTDQIGTLNSLRAFMIQRWHNSFFYALAYLCFIYSE